jgi:hypothetical protein
MSYKSWLTEAHLHTTHLFLSQNLTSLLLPQHTKLKEQISEVLDADLIKQQAEKGILDFQVSDKLLSLSPTAIRQVPLFFVLSSSSSRTISVFYGLTDGGLQSVLPSLFDFLPVVSSPDVKAGPG